MADTTDRPDDGMPKDGDEEHVEHDVAHAVDNGSIVVTGGTVVQGSINIHGHADGFKTENPPKSETLASERQKFYFKFLSKSLAQSDVMFGVSVAFMVLGGLIVLAGAAMALVRPDYLSLVTTLAGVLITGSSGAVAFHAYRAKAHTTVQAERIEDKIDKDDQWEKATSRIDQIESPELRDRLNATAAMRALGVTPDPETTADRVFAEAEVIEPEEIEPGDSKS